MTTTKKDSSHYIISSAFPLEDGGQLEYSVFSCNTKLHSAKSFKIVTSSQVRLSLRRVSNGGEDDSGRDSDGGSRTGRRRRRRNLRAPTPPPPSRAEDPRQDPAARLVSVIQHQSRTIHQQIDKLRWVL